MANDVKLQEGHPVDENLRPLKVGGKSTAIETAQHGNGARVNGDLEVTDDIKGLSLATNSINSADLAIDDAGSISLDATSSNSGTGILFKNAGTLIGDITAHHSGTFLKLYENEGASTTDYVEIKCEANGASTLSTVDGSGNTAHLILDVDGRLVLDSHTGGFSARNAGTEFSVADSSYAGMILGYTTVGIDAADDSQGLTASMAVTDSAHKVKFVAPPSGVVEIFVSIYADFNRRTLTLGLSDNATYNALDVTHEHLVKFPPVALGDQQINHHWVITGLTAGTAYEYWFGAKSTHSLTTILKWGGDVSGEYAPFIMKATALPTAVADYAVYG